MIQLSNGTQFSTDDLDTERKILTKVQFKGDDQRTLFIFIHLWSKPTDIVFQYF